MISHRPSENLFRRFVLDHTQANAALGAARVRDLGGANRVEAPLIETDAAPEIGPEENRTDRDGGLYCG